MSTRVAFGILSVVLLMGCNDRSEELQKQLARAQGDQQSTKQLLSERDKYVEEIVQAVNDVYKDLEQSRLKEGRLLKQTQGVERNSQTPTMDTRHDLLTDIGDIGSALKENRKRISALQVRMRKFNIQIASLDSLVGSLKASLEEREQSIAQLESEVKGLEATVAEKTKTIRDRELVIDDQNRQLTTGFYVVGTRDELKKKGIITDEGGFLWGLLGSTTVLANDVDPTEFTPISKTADKTIHVPGKIEEILPRRKENVFAMAQSDEKSSDLKIVSPEKFWQSNYLVIVVD